eukprot:scaffold9394_cov124-Isochrysis_galbana.AAC.1
MNFQIIIASARVPIPALGKAKRIAIGEDFNYDWASAEVECAFVCSPTKSAKRAMSSAVGVSRNNCPVDNMLVVKVVVFGG